MPSSVVNLLDAAGLTWDSVTRWGTKPSLEEPGVYIVSTSADPDSRAGPPALSLSEDRLAELLRARPEVTIAGQPADLDSLGQALRMMSPTGETVLYVGLAGTTVTVAHRVGQFYRTTIGARAPHAGGWPIKMLAHVDALYVHAAATGDPDRAEKDALRAFMEGVTDRARAGLCDSTLPLPYANLELTKGRRKRHTIAGASGSHAGTAVRTRHSAPPTERPAPQPRGESVMAYTLNVTAADVASGQIRVTGAPKQALALPRVKTTVSIILRGEAMTAVWDPRLGPDKERSGLLRIGKPAALRLFGGPVNLAVERDESGLLNFR